MIRIIRHISIRVWLSCLFGIPLSFSLLRVVNLSSLSVPYPLGVALILLIILYFLIGAILHHTGKKLVLDMISRAQAWERAGIFRKAEQYYLKAIRIYDSFLLSPMFLEKTLGKKVAGAVAGFLLSSGTLNPLLERCIPKYLRIDPTDEDVAVFWLKRAASLSSSDPDEVDQEVLTLIAENYNGNIKVLPFLADIFLKLHRTDFTARKIYKDALKHSKNKSILKSRINELLSRMEDGSEEPSGVDIRIPEPERVTERPAAAPERKSAIQTGISSLTAGFLSLALTLAGILKKAGVFTFSLTRDTANRIRSSENAVRYARRLILAAAVSVALVFAVNTVLHLFKTKVPEKTAEKIEKQAIPKPFTLQVAAYLEPRHAKNYVNKLQKQGLDATYSKSEGGGKTWYLVRVSSFSDKTSAASYGKELKKKGIIDDFFVDNR